MMVVYCACKAHAGFYKFRNLSREELQIQKFHADVSWALNVLVACIAGFEVLGYFRILQGKQMQVDRRNFLSIGAAGLGGIVLSGCGGGDGESSASRIASQSQAVWAWGLKQKLELIPSCFNGDGSINNSNLFSTQNSQWLTESGLLSANHSYFSVCPPKGYYGSGIRYVSSGVESAIQPYFVNKGVVQFDIPRPAELTDVDNRIIVAVDVCFVGGYLSDKVGDRNGFNHMGLTARMKNGPYYGAPGHRATAIIAGPNYNPPQLELIEGLTPNGGDGLITSTSVPTITENHWYTFIHESIMINGQLVLAYRILDRQTGNLIGQIADRYTNSGSWYQENTATVGLFTIRDSDGSANFLYTNMRAYWMHGGDWVPNP